VDFAMVCRAAAGGASWTMPALAVWIALAVTLTNTATLEPQRSSHPSHGPSEAHRWLRRVQGRRAAAGGSLWRSRGQLVLRGGGEDLTEGTAGVDGEERLEMVGKVTEEVTEGAATFLQATFFLFDEVPTRVPRKPVDSSQPLPASTPARFSYGPACPLCEDLPQMFPDRLHHPSRPPLPGGNPGVNLKSISHRCHPILVAFVWELTK